MNDVEFTRALERGEIANENFRHTAHLHVAWVYLFESSSVEGAAAKMRATLRKFAASAGKPGISRDDHTFLGSLARARPRNRIEGKPGKRRGSESAVTGKGFPIRLLFA